jgi:hypothetical protein
MNEPKFVMNKMALTTEFHERLNSPSISHEIMKFCPTPVGSPSYGPDLFGEAVYGDGHARMNPAMVARRS